jgi:site-specific recombinase XerD
MKTHFHLIFDPNAGTGYSPYRLLDGTGSPVRIINEFLDAQAIRSLSPRSLRAYGFDLLNFATWWAARRKRSSLQSLTQSHLLEYVRHQLTLKPRPTAQTVNHRLTVLRCLYRFHSGSDIPWSRSSVVTSYKTQNPLGYGRPTHGVTGLKLKQTRRVVIPLSAEEVLRFWKSFRTYRDISIVTLMLADGLRSREVLALHCSDLVLSQACLRVSGKGNKERILPLSEETLETINQTAHDPGRLALPFSPSSKENRNRSSQSASLPAYLRSRHGAGRRFPACVDAPYGTRQHPNYFALHRTFS